MWRRTSVAVMLAELVGVLWFASPANAYDWGPVDAHVTVIEPSNVGTLSGTSQAYAAVYFQVDQSGGTGCSAGTWLYWAPRYFGDTNSTNEDLRQIANTRAILATLQLAVATGTKVKMYGFNASGGYCQISNIYSLNY